MSHPFNLSLTELKTLDLEFEESLTSEEAATVSGALSLVWPPRPRPYPLPRPRPICPPIEPPKHTTLALGEEGGWHPPEVTTLALGEEGGIDPFS